MENHLMAWDRLTNVNETKRLHLVSLLKDGSDDDDRELVGFSYRVPNS